MRPMAWVLLAAVSATALRAAAAPPEPGFELRWEAPADCPQQDAMLDKVKALLAGSPPAGEPVQATGTIRRAESGMFQLSLDTRQGERSFHRSIEAASCTEAADAGALIVALAVDPELPSRDVQVRASDGATTTPEPLPTRPEPLKPPPSSAAPAAPARPAASKPRAVRGSVSDMLIGDVGTLPPPAWGGEFGLGLGLSPLRFELLFTVLPERRRIIRRDPDRGGDFELLAGGLRGCYLLGARLLVGGCLGLELGRTQGVGVGTDRIAEREETWFAGRAGAVAMYPHGGLAAVRASLEGLIPVTRPEFELDNVGSVHQAGFVIGRLGLGLEMSFP